MAENLSLRRLEPIKATFPTIFSTYPRERPPLSERHAEIYAEQYRINRDGDTIVDGAAQKLEEWMHRQITAHKGGPLLELGAGTLNHLPFEPETTPYDIVEPFTGLFEGRPEAARIRNFYIDMADVPEEQSYKRIISVAVLEHLPNLPRDVARSALMLEEDGVFQAGIPSEGGLLWWAGWRFSTGLAYYLRTGLDYGVVMRHEHLNKAREIEQVVRQFFGKVKIARFPTPFHHLSFYAYVEASGPNKEAARRFLEGAAKA